MIKSLLKNNTLLLPLFSFLFIQACTQMDKTLGENFIPEGQLLKVAYFEDASYFCRFSTVHPKDSINTAGSNFSYGVVGIVDDERLGKTSAGFATTFIPIEYGYAFEEGVTGYDSAFLVLDFSSVAPYGSGKDSMKLLVYEMKSTIGDVVYGTTAGLIDTMFYPTLVNGEGEKVNHNSAVGYIRLTDTALLSKLFKKIENAETFADNVKGLYVTVDTTGVTNGCIMYADILSTSSYKPVIVAFYTVADDTIPHQFYYVAYQSSTPRFNVFRHNYSGASVEMNNPTTPFFASKGLGGVAIQMEFNLDSIKAWKGDKRITINRAELILPVEDSEKPSVINERYSQTMSCIAMISDPNTHIRSYSSILDMYSGTFGGAINRSRMEYAINITHAFNDALLKGNNNPMLIIPGDYVNSARSIFISNKPEKKPQLKIWYGEVW